MTNGLHTAANLDFVPHQTLHPSPLGWRDQFISFLLVDRFDYNAPNLPAFAPAQSGQGHRFQGGNLQGIKRKIRAYHVFVHAGIVSQGLLHYLAACFPKQVWRSFGSWLRTIRPGIAPSERVISMALRNSFPEFLLANAHSHNFAKFIVQRQDFYSLDVFRIASG